MHRKAISELKKLDLLNWSTLLIGLQKDWLSLLDIEDYATSILLDNKHDQTNHQMVILLASAHSLQKTEINDFLQKLQDEFGTDEKALDKWRLAFLITLNKQRISNHERLEKLEEIYAKFDYPKDMNACSIYSNETIYPLSAMNNLITQLKKNFSSKNRFPVPTLIFLAISTWSLQYTIHSTLVTLHRR